MRYETASAFRTALERRLLIRSQQTGTPLVRLRKLVAFDRLLARLLIAAPNRWLLKGALALDYRLGSRFRTTKDLDLSRQDDEQAATDDFLAVQRIDLQDYFTFAIQKTATLDAAREGAAVRYHVVAELAGRRFEDVTVDVGFGDPLILASETLRGPDLLRFAGIEPVAAPAISLEQHTAEKVHAYTRIYANQRRSSRAKDLIDLALIQATAVVNAGQLHGALRITFTNRATHALPTTLPPPPTTWEAAYRQLARDVDLAPDITSGYQLAAAFLNPVLGRTVGDDAAWDPGAEAWQRRDPPSNS